MFVASASSFIFFSPFPFAIIRDEIVAARKIVSTIGVAVSLQEQLAFDVLLCSTKVG